MWEVFNCWLTKSNTGEDLRRDDECKVAHERNESRECSAQN